MVGSIPYRPVIGFSASLATSGCTFTRPCAPSTTAVWLPHVRNRTADASNPSYGRVGLSRSMEESNA